MRRMFADNKWDLADNLLIAFANCGYWLDRDTRILDFGCGTGSLVYRLRDLGYQAFGFEIDGRIDYRSEQDRAYFRILENPNADKSNRVIARDLFRLPFDDNTFDVIVSTSVLEHVMDPGHVMSEISRIMKQDGFAFHLYPRKSVIIEPHMFVPFASRWQNWWYFYFWAALGIRIDSQRGMSAHEVADANVKYARTALKYSTDRELTAHCGQYFRSVRFVSNSYYYNADWTVFLRNRLNALRSNRPLHNFSAALKMGALLTEGKARPLLKPPPSP